MSFLMVISPGDDFFLLRKTLRSILEQEFKAFSVTLILNGILNPQINKILKNFENNFFSTCRITSLNVTRSLPYALNHGLRFVEEAITLRIDPDDFCAPARTEMVAEIFLNSGVDILGSNIIEIDNVKRNFSFRRYPNNSDQIVSKMLWNNQLAHSSVSFKTHKIIELGGYPNIYKQEDYGLWLMAIKNKLLLENDARVHTLMNIDGMHKRRTGFKLIKSEFAIMKIKLGMQVYGFYKVLISFVVRSSYHILPSISKKNIHLLMRKNFTNYSLCSTLIKNYNSD